MFNPKETPKYERMLESELERVIIRLRTEMVNTEDYAKTLGLVERLHDRMNKEKSSGVSKETMLTVAANLLGIIMILKSEYAGNFISSKALGFVIRTK